MQLPVGSGYRNEHRGRLFADQLGHRLRRHGVRAGLRHHPPSPVLGTHSTDPDRLGHHGRTSGSSGPAVPAQGAAGESRCAGLARHGRYGTGILDLQRLLRRCAAARLPEPHPCQPAQRGLLDPGLNACRAAAARYPQRHVRIGHDRRIGQGRVQLRAARDRFQIRRRGHHWR
ncbi:hypothetical protein D3C74_393390 [compost metagenome]